MQVVEIVIRNNTYKISCESGKKSHLLRLANSFDKLVGSVSQKTGVFVHEYGHYVVAKACKVKVESFSIGFGPEMFGFNDKSGTRWKLSAVPLGGYVKMLGDTNAASVPADQKELTEEEKLYSFHTKPRTAGYYRTPPVIRDVIEGSAAKQAGLLPGDTITQINEHKIKYFEDISRVIMSNPKTRMEIKYSRNNEERRTSLTPLTIESRDVFGNVIERETIGIISVNTLKLSSFLGAVSLSVSETYHTMCLTIKAIFQIIV
ncbi:uncharacterized protein LOC115245975, partial [Formica exsecta]|uniref:uncharacterized protein LOC115245975 n=1 Tax=Formica exsecta TaxID=72781 RepID=UPI001143ADC9